MDAGVPKRLVGAAAIAATCVAAALVPRGDDGARVARAAPGGSVFARIDGKLARVDPVTLRRRGRAVAIADGPMSFSPDGRTLAVAGAIEPLVHLVDVGRMDAGPGAIGLGRNVIVDTMQWLDASTIAVVAWGDPPRLLLVDAVMRRVTERRALSGVVLARARSREALVLLLGRDDRIGASTLLVVDAARGVRTVELREIKGGFAPVGDARTGDHRKVAPGLAADPFGARAVVVPPAGRVAEIDLTSLAVRYHELARPASILGRLRDWLEPRAHAKSVAGPERYAQWVGRHAVAVAAVDQAGIRARGGQHRQLGRAGGVQLIDTRKWSVRTLAERAGSVAVAGETAVVYGGPFAAGGSFSADHGAPVTGLHGFTAGGDARFRLFPSSHVRHVDTAAGYAYVTRAGGSIHVVDVTAGRVVGTVRTPTRVYVLAP